MVSEEKAPHPDASRREEGTGRVRLVREEGTRRVQLVREGGRGAARLCGVGGAHGVAEAEDDEEVGHLGWRRAREASQPRGLQQEQMIC